MSYLNTSTIPWLTLLFLTPLAGMLLVGLAAAMRMDNRLVKIGATAWSLIPIGIACVLYAGFDPRATAQGQSIVQFVEMVPWTEVVRVEYFLGIDGLSLPLILLTVLMTPIAMLASFGVEQHVKPFFALLFLLEATMLGTFVALNFFFFFIFWELSLVPGFFLIQHWGRDPERRRGAAFTFFIYTLAGSIGMLLLFLLIYAATSAAGFATFDLITLGRLGQGLAADGVPGTAGDLQSIIFRFVEQTSIVDVLGRFPLLYTSIAFWGIFIALAIKLAVWPFHTWLPDSYTEAPTAGSILLAAVMSKMGGYAMLRILLPLFPDAARLAAPLIGALALIGVLVGAFGALNQASGGGDLKRLIAYTSINHMGYVGLAVAAIAMLAPTDPGSRAIAVNGAVMQMVAHGLSTGALFLLAGVLYERTGTYQIRALGGLQKSMPTLAGVMGIATFANLGLPGLAGFVGEFFIIRGVWATLPLYALLATIGLVVTALALLQMFGQIFHGPPAAERQAADLPVMSREFLAVIPLLLALLALGLWPAIIMDLSNQAVRIGF